MKTTKIAGREITREMIEAEAARCDAMGREAYLTETGYGESRIYKLRLNGRSYDSKAIVGNALGLTRKQFSGGAATVVRVLRDLGFNVREGRVLKSSLRKFAAMLGLCAAPVALPVEPVASFSSGVKSPAEIRGHAAVGHDIGVAAPHLSEAAIEELINLRGSDVQVFVDSGAFSEVTFGANGPTVVKLITDDEWNKRLAVALRIAEGLGDQAHIVAPDMVGHQAETLDRLRLYSAQVERIRATGARILVPMQKGELSQAEFFAKVVEVLGEDFTPSLPMKKAATTVEELAEFAAAVQPATIHLLGLGTKNCKASAAMSAIEDNAPQCLITMDSNRMAAMCARKEGKPRRLTRTQDFVRELGVVCKSTVKELGVILAFGPFEVPAAC